MSGKFESGQSCPLDPVDAPKTLEIGDVTWSTDRLRSAMISSRSR